ncbi:hypothetical protein DMJ13_15045 [halophilic archaeon]|nr:hypothetical protein DMJ13_15045 [halophilic archaeon]
MASPDSGGDRRETDAERAVPVGGSPAPEPSLAGTVQNPEIGRRWRRTHTVLVAPGLEVSMTLQTRFARSRSRFEVVSP